MINEFFRDKSPARLTMIAALLLLFVSQFFLYMNDAGSGYIPNAMNLNEYTQVVITGFAQVGTGWDLHPHAYVILIVLGFAFLRDDIAESALFSRAGWWVSLILIIAAILPGAPLRDAIGASMGAVAALIALVAVIMHRGETRRQDTSSKTPSPN